jgi:Spy/CpxP family protein refolding chaperone
MRHMRTRLTFDGVCLVLAGTPLVAHQPAPGRGPAGRRPMPPMAQMPMADCPMLSAMTNGPTAALHAGSALKLSGEQRRKLEGLERQLGEASKPSMDSMLVIHGQLMALAQKPTLDESAARVAFERMGRLHTEMGLTMLRAAHEVAGVLTPAQRDSLAAIARRQTPPMPLHGKPMSGMPMHPMSGMPAAPKR